MSHKFEYLTNQIYRPALYYQSTLVEKGEINHKKIKDLYPLYENEQAKCTRWKNGNINKIGTRDITCIVNAKTHFLLKKLENERYQLKWSCFMGTDGWYDKKTCILV